MATPRLQPAQQRTALRVLGRDRLRELTDHFELDVGDKRVVDNHVDALARSRRVDFADVLARLSRKELKAICAALGLETSGKAKEPIVQRILDAGFESAPREEERAAETAAPQRPQAAGTASGIVVQALGDSLWKAACEILASHGAHGGGEGQAEADGDGGDE